MSNSNCSFTRVELPQRALNRRQFIYTSALAASALAAGGCVIPRARLKSPNEKLNIGAIGAGGKGGIGGEGKAGGNGGAAYGDADAGADAGTRVGQGGSGGPGGKGGNGGSGAGGNGGPSYALVYKGTAPNKLNGTTLVHGAGGAKGIGGSIDTVKAPDGIVGTAAEEFSVP